MLFRLSRISWVLKDNKTMVHNIESFFCAEHVISEILCIPEICAYPTIIDVLGMIATPKMPHFYAGEHLVVRCGNVDRQVIATCETGSEVGFWQYDQINCFVQASIVTLNGDNKYFW